MNLSHPGLTQPQEGLSGTDKAILRHQRHLFILLLTACTKSVLLFSLPMSCFAPLPLPLSISSHPIPSINVPFASGGPWIKTKHESDSPSQLSSQFVLRFHDSTLRRRKRAPCPQPSPFDNSHWPIARLQINQLFYLGIGPCSIAPLQ